MPIYEYICNCCGESFSRLVPYEKKEKVSCVHCNSKDVTSVPSVTGFRYDHTVKGR